jgi:aspartyl-tRNA(Asn)/glutamyl-tRNA(Gln) amidotransferase subunit C
MVIFFGILTDNMAQLSREDILKLAKLSKIALKDDEVEHFRIELQKIVGYVEQLQSVDVSGLKPTDQISGLKSVTRPDQRRSYASQEELLKNLPRREDDLIKVNRMLG